MPASGQPQSDLAADSDNRAASATPPPPSERLSIGGGLPTRLLALFLLCLLPVFIADIYASVDFRTRQRTALSDMAMRQAELASTDTNSLVESARQLLQAIAQLASVRSHEPGCRADLTALQQHLPDYAFLAVLDADGTVVCASLPDIQAGQRPAWGPNIPELGDFRLGHFDRLPDGRTFLPMIQAIPGAGTAGPSGPDGGAIVAALDLRWLGGHLAALWRGRAMARLDSTVVVTDADATVIGRYPDAADWVGRPLFDEAMNLTGETRAGVRILRLPDGGDQLAGFVPAPVPPVGLATIVLIPLQDMVPWFDVPGGREIIIVAGAGLLAIALTLLAGRRYYMRPLQNLLRATQLLRDGNLSARAEVSPRSPELGRLAATFNRMAATLQARDAAQRHTTATLEERLAASTQSLADAKARLQTETAQRERAEAALQETRKAQAVGEISGAIAHDFNNILATVLGSLDLLDRHLQDARLGRDTAAVERLSNLVARAVEAVQRGAQLATRLRALSHRRRPAASQADLASLFGDVAVLAAGSLGGGARIRTDLPDGMWPVAIGPDQAEAAVLTLCQAARTAEANGGRLLIAAANTTVGTATAGGPPPGDYVRLTLRDSGGRSSPESLARALAPFVHGPNRTTGPHGGDAKDGNAEASVMLMRVVPGPTGALRPQATRRTDMRLAAQPPVMVVDDDAAVRLVTVDMLRELGCDVIEATSAQEALAMLDEQSHGVGVMLIDYAMPGKNGIELARAVRARGITVPVVLATGFADLGDAGEAHTALLDVLLRKPFTMAELHATLTRLQGVRETPSDSPVPVAPHTWA